MSTLNIILIILVVALAYLWFTTNKDDRAEIDALLLELREARTRHVDLLRMGQVQNYLALEQGMTELEESYQAEIMDRDDKIAHYQDCVLALQQANASLVEEYAAYSEEYAEKLHNVYEAHRLLKEEKDLRIKELEEEIEGLHASVATWEKAGAPDVGELDI